MARSIGKLSARRVETLHKPGRFSDGGNLYLSIGKASGKRWVFLYRWDGRQRELGLGSAANGEVSLARARDLAQEARNLLNADIDPIEYKKERAQKAREVPNFGDFADDYIANHKVKWRNERHIAQWEMTLDRYCGVIRGLPITAIDTDAILKVLQPIWTQVPETASRLRGRIENILDAAKAKGLRSGDNPAAWRGHLKTLLPARQRLTRGHHAALAYEQVPRFVAELHTRASTAALALEFCILTATRTGEVLNADWREFDLERAIWTIPATRMKAGFEHRIPLTSRAIAILNTLNEGRISNHVFPGSFNGKPLSGMAMAMQLRRMNRPNITVHGFRSSFRDWASEQTSYPHETCEHALAHRISDKAEAAYRRGDQFEKRRRLMEDWERYCTSC